MIIQQPTDLMRFIRGIPVLGDGTIPLNNINSNPEFISKMYEPTYALSALARITQDILARGDIEEIDMPLGDHTLVKKVLDSDIPSYTPNIYLLIRAIVLESFSLIHNIDFNRDNLRYVSSRDIEKVRENTRYVADYMSTEEKYRKIIESLRDIDVSFGYIQHQIDVILRNRGVRR